MIVAEQECPVCARTIRLHVAPFRWIHDWPCSSPTYERLCDPHPFASALTDSAAAIHARARVRGRARSNLYRGRARGSRRNSPIQALKDDASAD